jgi:hypothetical protein
MTAEFVVIYKKAESEQGLICVLADNILDAKELTKRIPKDQTVGVYPLFKDIPRSDESGEE